MPIEFKKNRASISRRSGRGGGGRAARVARRREPTAKADLSACTHLHTANLQVLMAAGRAYPVGRKNQSCARGSRPALNLVE